MNESRNMWIGIVAVVVVAALGLWWLSASQSVPTNVGMTASSTGAAATGNSISRVNRPTSSVIAIAENIPDASIFGAWLASTRVAAEVTGKGPYTIFVPTNAAIAAMKPGTFSNLSAAEKKRFVQYAVVAGRAIDVGAELAGTIQALSRDYLNFSNTNNIPMVNSGIVIAQYKGSNGIVYVINTALIPPKKTTP